MPPTQRRRRSTGLWPTDLRTSAVAPPRPERRHGKSEDSDLDVHVATLAALVPHLRKHDSSPPRREVAGGAVGPTSVDPQLPNGPGAPRTPAPPGNQATQVERGTDPRPDDNLPWLNLSRHPEALPIDEVSGLRSGRLFGQRRLRRRCQSRGRARARQALQAAPSPSASSPFGLLAGPPAAMKASCAAAWVEKFEQSRSAFAGTGKRMQKPTGAAISNVATRIRVRSTASNTTSSVRQASQTGTVIPDRRAEQCDGEDQGGQHHRRARPLENA